MQTKKFDPQYYLITPSGNMNYVGAVAEYFDEINKFWSDQTQDKYVYYYNERIFPLVSLAIPISDYTEDMLSDLISKIQSSYNLSDSTITSTIRHLVYDPYKRYQADIGIQIGKSSWGSSYHFQGVDDIESALLILKKSFTKKEQEKILVLLRDPTATGEMVGVAIIALTGVRLNEACGLNYRDIFSLISHPEVFFLRIGETTEHNSNVLKLGGKTENSPRILPLIQALYDFLKDRMDYLQSIITFPIRDEDGNVYRSVYDLPIVCKGDNFTKRCRSNDLTTAGGAFLRDVLAISEDRVSGLDIVRRQDREIIEADPTTYLFRRNFATKMMLTGFTDLEARYYIGHKLDNDLYRRSDFTDEDYLFAMWQKLQNFPC